MRKLELTSKQITILEFVLIIAFSLFPLVNSFPYRINIFLSWEGAYRLYLGHIPYKDFGLPMGFGYWVIPAIFFKIFGPYLYTLIKAQIFINFLSGLAFRSILKSFEINQGIRLISLLLYIISYSFFNFWPWYNHSVIVFEFIGLSFLLKFLFRTRNNWKAFLNISLASFFIFFSFFTKQDGGGLAFLIALFLTLYHVIIDKKYVDLIYFLGTYALWAIVIIIPFLKYDFTYWFNLGQEPHYSRIELWDFITTILGESMWEKFYLAGFILIMLINWTRLQVFVRNKKEFLFFLFSLGILVEALIFQVTSYTPPDNNIFFHSFIFAYFISAAPIKLSFNKLTNIVIMSMIVMIWWSGAYWKYIDRKVERLFPQLTQVDKGKISKNTYAVSDNENNIGMEKWIFSDLRSFKKIYMPESTVLGIKRLLLRKEIRKENPKILNMSELTPLAHEIGFELEKGRPLWYHKGVGIFQEQIDDYIIEINEEYYDIVLFETIPYLNNFYPDEVRNSLTENYKMIDKFLAPRRPTDSYIEVYARK